MDRGSHKQETGIPPTPPHPTPRTCARLPFSPTHLPYSLKWASSCVYATNGPPRLQEEAKPLMIEPLPCVGVVIDIVVHALAVPLVVSPLPYKGQHMLIKKQVLKNRLMSQPLLTQQEPNFVTGRAKLAASLLTSCLCTHPFLLCQLSVREDTDLEGGCMSREPQTSSCFQMPVAA